MRWTPGGRSADLEDRRAEGFGGRFGGGGMRTAGGLGIGGVLLLLVLSLVTGRDFFSLLDTGDSATVPASRTGPPDTPAADEPMMQFVSFVLDDSQNTWSQLLPGRYEHTRLVVFRDAIDSACGLAESATGPFYCPGDRKVYIDLGFFEELRRRFGAPGDFAQAYVLAHEVGHHVQAILGVEARVRQQQQRDPRAAGELSVRTELQADCFAGIWGHSTARRDILEAGDIEEGLNAAGAIGDDRLQRMATGRVSPEKFTHGSSAQRVAWFRRGLESGSIDACNTFGASGL